MDSRYIKLAVTAVILLILFMIAWAILKTIVKALLPVAIVVVAGYIIYKVVLKK